jgi:exodeoxyribonuclease VIII
MSSVPDFMTEALASAGEQPLLLPPAQLAPANEPAAEPPPFAAGVFRDMPTETYFAIDAMSQSGAKEILRSPAHFRYARENPRQPTPAMRFGTAVHAGILEPERFEADVVCAPAVNARTTAGREQRDAFLAANAGRLVLAADDYDRARRCIEAVGRHPAAKALLTGAEVEVSIFWLDGRHKAPCKGRIDARNHGGLIDIKTTQDASPEEYSRTIASYGYHLQAAHYFSGCEHLLDATPQFFAHVVVETEAPHGVAVYAIPGNAIMAGAARMSEALRRYADARETGRWNSYPTTIESIQLPRWATRFDH